MRTLAAALLPSLLLVLLVPAPAAAAGYDSAYRFESAFVTLRPGDTAQLSVFFDNTGTSSWVAGTSTQVNLAACRSDKVTCNVASDKVAWNPGTWPSSTAYATQAKATVAPGDFTAFSYSVKAPASIAAGSYRFNGDLVLAATGATLHPEGYYQDATVAGSAASQAAAPTDVRALVGNYDNGPIANDVKVLFTAPATNTIRAYDVQRTNSLCPATPSSAAFFTAATVTVLPGNEAGYTDNDLKSGNWCYQVRATDPSTGAFSYSNQVSATVFGPATPGSAVSTSAVLTNSSGDAASLDTGDIFTVTFSQAMTVSSSATIQLTDADCGPPANQGAPPAACSGSSVQTVSTVACGSNANCVLSFDALTLTVTMTGNPIDVVAGSAPGTQFPAVFTSSTGITDSTANRTQWQIGSSSDRVIGPLGQ